MTPDRSEIEAAKICPVDEDKPLPFRGRDDLRIGIAAALREAYERGVKETLGIQSSVADLERDAYQQGFLACREAAANVAEDFVGPRGYEGSTITARACAKAIRALSPSGEKEDGK